MVFTDERKELYYYLEGDRVTLTEEMFQGIDPEKVQDILRVYDADRKRQERESRCFLSSRKRCMERCSQCKKKRDGKPLSIDMVKEKDCRLNVPMNMEEQVIRNECYQELHNIINELDEIERQIIMLCFYENKTEREIAGIIGFKQKRVNCRKHKILKKMKEYLQDFA